MSASSPKGDTPAELSERVMELLRGAKQPLGYTAIWDWFYDQGYPVDPTPLSDALDDLQRAGRIQWQDSGGFSAAEEEAGHADDADARVDAGHGDTSLKDGSG